MEKLVEELIQRLEATRNEIIRKLRSQPTDADNKAFLLMSGEVLAYDACIKELERLIEYFKESNVKINGTYRGY